MAMDGWVGVGPQPCNRVAGMAFCTHILHKKTFLQPWVGKVERVQVLL